MNIVQISQIIGVVSILLLYLIDFYIVIHQPSFRKTGRIALFWTSVYVLFLFVLRAIQLTGIATQDVLRILAGLSTLIPLIAVVAHLWLNKKVADLGETDTIVSQQEGVKIEQTIKVKK